MSNPPYIKLLCRTEIADWTELGGIDEAPCATVTIEPDGEPTNFYVASWLDVKSLVAAMMAKTLPGGGSIVQSPFIESFTRGVFSLVGAATKTACEALRPKHKTGDLIVDGGCQPAVLTIH